MRTKDLIFFKIPVHTDEWYRFRTTGLTERDSIKLNCPQFNGGIGSSECATIMRQNPFDKARPIAPDYYYWKIGLITPHYEPSELMVMGLETEELIKNRWRCFDGKDFLTRYINWKNSKPNEASDHILRNAKRINSYIVNKKYPWLFTSLDFWAENNSFSLTTGENIKDGFPLETKNTSYYFVKNYLNEFPDSFNIQVHQEMIVTDSEYAEVAMLVDRKFKCFPVERNESLCNEILERTYEFWQAVIKAKECLSLRDIALKNNNKEEADRQMAIIESMEPMPDDSEGYKDYIKERYIREQESVKAGMNYYNLGMMDKKLLHVENIVKKKRLFCYNVLAKKAQEEKADILDFEESGKIQLFPKYRNGLKDEVNKENIEKELNKIDFNSI